MSDRERVGVVTEGSLAEGLKVRLEPQASVENMRAGNFVVVQGQSKDFFCLVSDVTLESTNAQVLMDPPGDAESFARQVLSGTSIFGSVSLAPMLMLEREQTETDSGLRPVKTVPSHFSPAFIASENDFKQVFGLEEGNNFQIGKPLDMEVPVCINLEKFVERSNGIFGKSGTGKSFLARIVLAGIIKTDVASNLIFDMHNEYAWETENESGGFVKGLRQLFQTRVAVFSLDPDVSRKQGVNVDHEIRIGLNQIEPGDILLLQEELQLSATAATQTDLLYGVYKENWVTALLDMDNDGIKAFVEERGGHEGALASLQSRLRRIEALPFVTRESGTSAIEQMVETLDNRRHVILQFGRYGRLLEYILVANILTRRIHQHYQEKTDTYRLTKDRAQKPRQLMITIEEAHKFLNPQAAAQTIFGTIAREMRKYHVTLMIIDQRPSGIDSEVMSQIGTRITAALNDERDIESVFTGVSGSAHLRSMLATLDPKQQALIMGYALPMPVVVRTRAYDEKFYKDLGTDEALTKQERKDKSKKETDDVFGQ
jgi:uncharacterized protein